MTAENDGINYRERYQTGRIGKLLATKEGFGLLRRDVIAKIPDIKLEELRDWAYVFISPNGKDEITEPLKEVADDLVEAWLDEAEAYGLVPETISRLEKELNPQVE